MDNYISRQQTIDALNDLITGATESCFEWIYKDDALEAVKQLPSAQPEIIRCKDCKYYIVYRKKGVVPVCGLLRGATIRDDDDFCSRAKRKEDG